MDVRTMLLSGRYVEAARVHGKPAVEYEIEEMIFHDLADRALEAAQVLSYKELAELAATVVRNSGSYNNPKEGKRG